MLLHTRYRGWEYKIDEISPQRRLARWRWPALAQALLRSFLPTRIFLTRQLITAPRSWPSHLVLTPPSRCQNKAPASSGAPLPSMTHILPPKSRFTVEPAPMHLLVASRFSTLAPHRPFSGAMYWIACSPLGRRHPRARRKAPRDLGEGLANGPPPNFDEHTSKRPVLPSR